ncbi:MAG: alpha/beta fold hydrolase [Candidatus Moranbacteria bacterium]|nr:alpha/beta fold hydrolase [Candidatus Moranbacteria bacterium]
MEEKIKKAIRTIKETLFVDPKLLYEKERHLVNQPFYFEGINGKAVLLIHGWSSVPYEVRRLGKYLNENGYTASGPMLRGHGTVPKDLENVKWADWLEDVEKSYLELRNKFDKVYVGGTSIGANLAIFLASRHPEISGLVLMATPYKLRIEKISLFFAKILRKFRRYNKKFYPPTFGVSTTLTRIISYQTYPVDSALETFNLVKASREKIPLVTQPCFLLQSSSDHIVSRNNMDSIYNKIASKIKKKQYIHRAYHTFISDIKNEHVFEDILNFLNEN